MKKHCIAMLLAGGQGSRLYALTAKVAKPSIPFGGKYRIIDFPLSNCANSGIDTVGVLTQYQPLLLNRYIGSGQAWDLDSIDGGVYILPPYQSAGERGSWFSGTANAIYQNMDFIEMYDPDCVLILSGDHVYKMDYDKMLRAHEQAGAACTISVIQVSMEEASRFGIMNVGPDGFINEFEEKPAHPKSDLASMGIYIFDWKALRRYLIEDDYDSEFRHTSRPIPAMQGVDRRGRVIYLGTFSRSIAPAIRVAYLILPPTLLERYRREFPLAASTVSRFEQEALRRFLVQGLYARHLRRAGALYRKKCARLTQALSAIPGAQLTGEQAGLHFLFTLPRLTEQELVDRAAARSVRVHPLSQYCHAVPPIPSTLVLGYAGLTEEDLDRAAGLLRDAYVLS